MSNIALFFFKIFNVIYIGHFWLFPDVQYWGVLCCSGGLWPGGKTGLVSGCFGAQVSVVSARG